MIMILLPAYNEELSLPPLFQKIKTTMDGMGAEYQVVLCNDGSSDATQAVAESFVGPLPLHIITHPLNRGLGETVRDLFEYAALQCGPDDIVVRLDCDDTHEPETIARMAAKLDEGYDVVLASRFQEGGGQMGVQGYRALISAGANIFMRIVFPVPGVREYSCGFRAYRGRVIQQAIAVWGNGFIQLKGLGFTGTLEKLIKLHLLGARFAEVPFVLRYDQKVSDSKMITSVTTLGYMVMAMLYHWPWGGWKRFRRTPARGGE
jgi:dolichol-phosphate mannosyltransferase